MTMHFYDGFDWYGQQGEAADEIRARGWNTSDSVAVESQDATSFWQDYEYTFTPYGRCLQLKGPKNQFIQMACRYWIDTACGFNVKFDLIPSGGPYKLIEFCDFINGEYYPRYTLAIHNGQFRTYAYGDIYRDTVLDDGPGYGRVTLQAGTRYGLHFYGRRNLRILYVNGVIEKYAGGFDGLDKCCSIRIYNPGRPTIDDFYTTYTQPAIWPGAYDTLLPCGIGVDATATEPGYMHPRILSPQPDEDVANEWTCHGGGEGAGLNACVKGTDDSYAGAYAMRLHSFGVKCEDVAYPYAATEGAVRCQHIQMFCRCARMGSVRNQLFTEGRMDGQEFNYDNTYFDPTTYMGEKFHADTVCFGNGTIYPDPMNYSIKTLYRKQHAINRTYTATPEQLNDISWWLRQLFKPAVFGRPDTFNQASMPISSAASGRLGFEGWEQWLRDSIGL